MELAAELGDFVRNDVAKFFPHLQNKIQISLIEGTGKVLGMFDPNISSYATTVLEQNGTQVLCHSIVTKVTEKSVHFQDVSGGAKGNRNGEVKGQDVNTSRSKVDSESESKANTSLSHQLDYGVLVWAGGINTRPITRDIITAINRLPPGSVQTSVPTTLEIGIGAEAGVTVPVGVTASVVNDNSNGNSNGHGVVLQQRQASRRGIEVDAKFRVKGLEQGNNVFALGDCAVVPGCAPTAQVQQYSISTL